MVTQLWRERRPARSARQHEQPRHWRTRADPVEEVWPQVLKWLEVDPDLTGKAAFERLMVTHPDRFKVGQLRTLQRKLQGWRAEQAVELVRRAGNEVA